MIEGFDNFSLDEDENDEYEIILLIGCERGEIDLIRYLNGEIVENNEDEYDDVFI